MFKPVAGRQVFPSLTAIASLEKWDEPLPEKPTDTDVERRLAAILRIAKKAPS